MDQQQLFFTLIIIAIIVAIGRVALKGWPKEIVSTDYNIEMAFNEFEDSILNAQYPDYDLIRRNIEAFKIENEGKIHADVLNKYVRRLLDALEEVEHGISYS